MHDYDIAKESISRSWGFDAYLLETIIIIPHYFAVTTEYTNTYPMWKAGRGTEAPFVLKATVYYPEERILYPLMHFNFSQLNHSSSKQEEIITIQVYIIKKLLLQDNFAAHVHHSWHNYQKRFKFIFRNPLTSTKAIVLVSGS